MSTTKLFIKRSFLSCRINWIGTAVNQFYAAVRKALVVVLVLRAIGILIGLGFAAWMFFQ